MSTIGPQDLFIDHSSNAASGLPERWASFRFKLLHSTLNVLGSMSQNSERKQTKFKLNIPHNFKCSAAFSNSD